MTGSFWRKIGVGGGFPLHRPTMRHAGLHALPPGIVDPGGLAAWADDETLEAMRRKARRGGQPLFIHHTGLLAAPLLRNRKTAALTSITCLRVETAAGWQPGWADTALAAAPLDADTSERCRSAIKALVAARVGGPIAVTAPDTTGGPRRILIVADQPIAENAEAGDVTGDTIDRMLDGALASHAAADIAIILPRQPLLAGVAHRARAAGCSTVFGITDFWPWIEGAEEIHCLGGDSGLLGLLTGRAVHAWTRGAYTGWGLTRDHFDGESKGTRSIEAIFEGICLLGTRYIDPFRNVESSFGETLDLLASWRRTFDSNARVSTCLGMAFWKQERIADFLSTPSHKPNCAKTSADALASARSGGGSVAFWPLQSLKDFPAEAREAGVACQRIEDGFIRSVGLGTNLMPPASIIADSRGIYFDPHSPSDLEVILKETDFTPALLERARRLIRLQIERGITKYNLAETLIAIEGTGGSRRILVPGQVEDDKSVLLGGAGITSNAELLRRARASNPDGYIIYKGHPDVEGGHRTGLVPRAVLDELADAVMPDASIVSLIDWADEVHSLTSLTGFEALIRGRKVVTYGQPFYAGWGLTEDKAPPVARRGRQLTIEELVAGVLILYPRYIDPVTLLPCGPEVLIERLARPELWRLGPLARSKWFLGQVMRRLGLSGSAFQSFK